MNRLRFLALAVAAALLLTGGCASRIFKETTEFGGRGSYMLVKPTSAGLSANAFADYTDFELTRLGDKTGGQTPSQVLAIMPTAFYEALAKANLPSSGGRTLLIRGDIWHYEKSGLFGQVFGPFEEALARVEFVDKASGRVVGEANIVGRTKTSRNQGPEEKGRGLARGIVKLIDDHFPASRKPPKTDS